MSGLFDEITRRVAAGETLAVATIFDTRGSTPREVGAKMLIRPDGGIVGTIGGGCGEADVWRAALDVIDTKLPAVVQVDLTQDMNLRTEAVCGGIMQVFVEARYPDNAEAEPGAPPPGDGFSAAIGAALQQRQAVALVTVVRASGSLLRGARLLVTAAQSEGSLGEAAVDAGAVQAARQALSGVTDRPFRLPLRDAAGAEVGEAFVELYLPAPRLLILGAGHIAQPLAKVGKLLDFEVVVLDDRAAFANRARFPEADDVLAADFAATLADYPVDRRTSIVLVTRGHQQDVAALRTLVYSDAPYIGMIGSKRRVWTVLKLLHDEGVPPEQLLRIYAPIGIDIEAVTPAEIAVAIGAELVKLRRGGSAASLSDTPRELFSKRLSRMVAGGPASATGLGDYVA
ncbi:MAG TPA: XdhC/CoxI family protein [Chloroflexota bacterium]|nr:XdhC/CoxI family protein [Chloroflexota bacterium]